VPTIRTPQTRRESLETLAPATAAKLLLTRHEAAEMLGLSVRKIDLLVSSGDLPAVRIGRSIRIRPSALDYLIESRESRSNVATRKRKNARPAATVEVTK
jgi:excisionase family DNA binding protein